jgi:hypothetical protein
MLRTASRNKAFTIASDYGLMAIFAAKEDWNNLRSVIQLVLDQAPGDPTALAYTYLEKNREEAPEAAERRATTQPTSQHWLDASLVYSCAARYQDSLRAALKARELEPGSGAANSFIIAAH